MSVKDVSKLYKTTCHRRRESDELDVFEAAGYFSGYNEAIGSEYNNNNNINGATQNTQKPTKGLPSENQYYHKKMNWRSSGGRMSLDVPFRSPIPQQQQDKQILKENNNNNNNSKYKQPSSPGGRLTSFLNSLFNQAGSKKKKKTKSTKEVVVDEESPGGWRRRRRSSISHFTNVSDSKSLINFPSANSGFRTPPPYAPTPTKGSYKEFRSFSDHHHHLKQVTGNYNSLASKQPPLTDHHVKVKPLGDAKSVENYYKDNGEAVVDDGAESDSSSDLFELQNYNLGLDVYSSGLPVYETTRIDGIKRGPPVIS